MCQSGFICCMKTYLLRFTEGNSVKEIRTFVANLRKVKGEEFLTTQDGLEIPVRNVLSVNGISFNF